MITRSISYSRYRRTATPVAAGIPTAATSAVHLATEVLGDPSDPQTPVRMRAFVDPALPQVRPQVSAQLLIPLADLVELEVDLRVWGRDQALCRAVAAVHSSR